MTDRDPDIALSLPEPPSANRLWRRAGAAIVLSDRYRSWLAEVRPLILAQRGPKAIPGRFAAHIYVPDTAKDIDNLAKPIFDALQKGGAIANDDRNRRFAVEIDESLRGIITVHLWALAGDPPRRRSPARTRANASKEHPR